MLDLGNGGAAVSRRRGFARLVSPSMKQGGHRLELLDLANRLVLAALRVPGVRSLSLLGSIATPKPDPKDIDLLVVISDDADVEALALHGRRLKGAAQGLNRGADIFLADERNEYLGRTCSWKECRPGVRRCDARHCGRRPFLHDDLDDVQLRPELIAAPPVTLWPEIIRRCPLPPDVEAAIERLSARLAGPEGR